MNFKIEQALLIVDPKGFLLDEIKIPTNELLSPAQQYSKVSTILKSNWTLYTSEDIVKLDWALGRLKYYLSSQVNQYNTLNLQPVLISSLEPVQTQLISTLQLLSQTIKRIFFYEIHINCSKFFKEFSITQLYLNCNNFEILKMISDVEVKFLQQQSLGEVIKEEERVMKNMVSRTIAGKIPFVESLTMMFEQEAKDMKCQVKFMTKENKEIDINLRQLLQKNPNLSSRQIVSSLQLPITQQDSIKLIFYLKLLKHLNNPSQLSHFLQFSKNMYLTLQQPSKLYESHWLTLYEATEKVLNMGKNDIVSINQVLKYPLKFSRIREIVQKGNLAEEHLLASLNFAIKNGYDDNEETKLFLKQHLNKIVQQSINNKKWEYSDDIFESLQFCTPQLQAKVFACYHSLLHRSLTQPITLSIFTLQKSFIHFFKYYLSSENPSNNVSCRLLLTPSLLSTVLANLTQPSQPTTLRLTHFIFNQSLYFSQSIPSFDSYIESLISDSEIKEILVQIFVGFLRKNMCLFKMNFKLVKKLVDRVYEKGEDKDIGNIQLCSLYWETNAKFLLFWGFRSYLEDELEGKEEYLENILFKLLEILPEIQDTHENQQKQLLHYLQNKSQLQDTNSSLPHTLNLLAYKNRSLSHNLLYSCLFLRDCLTGYQFKSILQLVMKLFTPLANVTMDSMVEAEFSFVEEIEIVAAEFAVQVLEVVAGFKGKEELEFGQSGNDGSGFFRSVWQPDRSSFIANLISHPVSTQNYESLIWLRRFELNLLFFNSVMQKLNSSAIKQIPEIKTIQHNFIEIIEHVQEKLEPIFWRQCLEGFYAKSVELRRDGRNSGNIEREVLTKTNSTLGFERLQITDKYLLFKYFKGFFDVYKVDISHKKMVEKSIRRAIQFLPHQDIEYTILSRAIELINLVQKYCSYSSQSQKKLKFSLLSPVLPNQLSLFTHKLSQLTSLTKHTQPSLISRKLLNLLSRQLNKYLIAYLLHDCISFHHHYSPLRFTEILTSHITLQKQILSFITEINNGCEQSHNVYLQILDSNISLFMTVMESNTNQDIKRPLVEYGKQLGEFVIGVIELMLFSTFQLGSRCRSSVLHILMGKYELVSGVLKKEWNAVLGRYLKGIFSEFLEFRFNEKTTELLFPFPSSQLFSIPLEPFSHLSKLQLACCQAMLLNLISRNNFPSLSVGLTSLFSHPSSLPYLNYLLLLTSQLSQLNTISDADLETLTVDVFGALEYVLSDVRDCGEIVKGMVKVLQELGKIGKIDVGTIRGNVVKCIVKQVLTHPSEESFALLNTLPPGSHSLLPRLLYLQNSLLAHKSPLHILNVLYYDRHNSKNIRLNWGTILQNHSEEFVLEFIENVKTSDVEGVNQIFLRDYQNRSEVLENVIREFVEYCLRYINGEENIGECYAAWRMVMGIGVRLPALIEQIYGYEIRTQEMKTRYKAVPEYWNQELQSLTFIDFVLDIVTIHPPFVIEFLHFIAKTNSGFKLVPTKSDQLLISNNLYTLKHFQTILLSRLQSLYTLPYSESKLISIHGLLKGLDLSLQLEGKLFSLYHITSPPRQVLKEYYEALRKPFLKEVYDFVGDNFEKSHGNPLVEEALVGLMATTLKKTMEEMDCQTEENVKYYLNNYLYSLMQGYAEYNWALREVEPVDFITKETPVKTAAATIYPNSATRYQNSFLSMSYSVFKQDEFEQFQAENQRLIGKLQMFGTGSEVSRLESAFKEISSLADERYELDLNNTFPSYDQTRKHQTFHITNNCQVQSSSTNIHERSHEESSGDYILDCDQFIEDGIVGDDEILQPDQNKQQKMSSFGQLMPNSSTNIKQLLKRVDKLEIMQDLELGRQVGHKLQFLSNDELMKLSMLAEGKLLLEIEHEKEFRGFAPSKIKFGNMQYQQPQQFRYLDELYPGCRKVNSVYEMIEQKTSIIPEMPEACLLRIFQMFVESFVDDQLHKKILKTIHQLCLHPRNLLFFTNVLYFTLSIKQSEISQLKQSFIGWINLDTLKSQCFQLISYLFEHKIGLVLWILGELNLKTLQLNNIRPPQFISSISLKLQRQELTVRIIELAALNINLRKPDSNLQRLFEVYNQYLEEKEGRYNIDYPWFDTPELTLSSPTVIEQLVVEILKKRKRVQQGSALELLFKLLLKIYPGCYETIMLHFFHESSVEIRKIVDHQCTTFKKFLTINAFHTDSFQTINKSQDMLLKVSESYSTFILDKNTNDTLLRQTASYLKQLYNDVYLGLLPWFKEWRFRVENREELGKHFEDVKDLKEKIQGAKIVKNYLELERFEKELRKLDYRLKDWKSEHKNEFLKSYIKPIHQCFSVNLLNSFKKSVDLLDETAQLFIPTEQNFKIVEPVYRNQSVVWQMILAFMSVYLQESTSSYHTMSKLVTRQHLREEEQHKKRRSRNSRKSIRMSLTHTIEGGFASISLMLRLGEKITLVGYYLKEGGELIKALAQYGTLDIKLKSIKRRKSGVVKEIQIDRNKIWFDSIIDIDEEFIDKDIRIKFKGEIGIDYGGLTKQWLTSITQELFNPNFGLFELSANKLTIQPSRFSHLVPQHLMHFRKLGLLVGKALIQDWALEINFTKSFLKHLLGNTIYVEDLFDIDPDTAKSLVWILDNEVNEDLQITFSIQENMLGGLTEIPLMENGQNIMVNETNKKQYVKAVCMYKMTEQIRPQAKAFMEGLQQVVPYDILKCMNHKELGLYLAGMPKINVQQMQKYSKYNNYAETEQPVKWFWEVLADFDEQKLANFLFFVSGSFKVPYGGFKEYPVVINRGFVVEHLPVAHTCFNTLDLPPYTSKLDLKKKLNIAISEGKGFGVS